MKFFNKIAVWGLLLIVSLLQFTGVVFAVVDPQPADTSTSGTILPGTSTTVTDCEFLMNEVSKDSCVAQILFGKTCTPSGILKGDKLPEGTTQNEILACGIKTGTIHLWMIPYYIKYVLTFIIGISGLACVGGIVYGGYMYLFAGVSNEKDQGKKAIQYGVIGMVMTLVAWAFVNIIIALVTG